MRPAGGSWRSQAGGVLLIETSGAAKLDRALRSELGRWRRPLAVHDPGKVVLDLVVTLALGGDCLADLAVLRAEPGVYGPVTSDPTLSRLIDTLAAECAACPGGVRCRPGDCPGSRATSRALLGARDVLHDDRGGVEAPGAVCRRLDGCSTAPAVADAG